jgi:phosphoglycerate kinase
MVTRLDEIKFIDEIELSGKRVFIRCDFNVPLKNGEITDSTRIDAALPTILYAIEHGAKVALGSHLGRPKGKEVPELSLKPVGEYLITALKKEIILTDSPDSEGLTKIMETLNDGQVVLLENLRFSPFEKKNDKIYAQRLAKSFDVYVNDAFGTAHRAEVSTEALSHEVNEKCAGLLIKKELEKFNHMLEAPESPFVAILGGAKVSDKIGVITNLMDKVDSIIIGGAMANTFMAAKGYDMGKSLVEADALEVAKQIIDKAERKGVTLNLPVDFVGADSFSNDSDFDEYTPEAFPHDKMALDIGEKTRENYRSIILKAKTIFWNGPMGVFELENFAKGTLAVAVAVTKSSAYSVVGGGDSVAAIKYLKLEDKISHVSTGGGASLEYIEGIDLPALVALKSK